MTRAKSANIAILIVDDHGLVREGLKRLVESAQDVVVAGEASTANEAVALLERRSFDVAVVDINLPGKTGIDLLQTLRRQWPALPVLMLSAAPEEHYAVRAVKLGASGYLTKDGALEMLVPAIRQIAAGGKYITARLADLLANEVAGAASSPGVLTERELEVLKLIAQGKSTSQIARALHLSDKTVGTYRTRIQDKTGLKSNAELARYALEHRLIN